jgi:hypothetical protein
LFSSGVSFFFVTLGSSIPRIATTPATATTIPIRIARRFRRGDERQLTWRRIRPAAAVA